MLRNRKAILIAAIIFGCIVSIFAAHLVTSGSGFIPRSGGGGETTLGKALTGIYGFTMLMVGVALGGIYRRLVDIKKQGVAQVQRRQLFSELGGSTDFLIGVVTSPVMFGMLWQTLGDISIGALTLVALQNGFAAHAASDQLVSGAKLPFLPSDKLPEVPLPISKTNKT
jgi:hypothetical protein